MLRSDEGFAAPLILILVLALVAVPAYYWVSNTQDDYSSAGDVRGAATSNLPSNPGFSVVIQSASPTWDLVEFLCVSLDECLTSLNSGRRLGTISGGETLSHEVVVEYSSEWEDYKFIKYFVRSGWYSSSTVFDVESLGEVPDSSIHTIKEGNDAYQVVVSPVSILKNAFYPSATFSNL